MELHELDVGHRHAGTQRHRDAVARGLLGIGGDGEELAGAAGRQERVRGAHLDALTLGCTSGHAAARAVLHDQVDGEPLLHDRRGGGLCGLDQRSLDLHTGGGAASVHDAGDGVATLAGERERAVLFAIEHGAERDQLGDARRPFVDEHADGFDIAETGARGEGVGEVEVGGVLVVAENGGDAALRPAGGGLLEFAFREDTDAQARRRGAHGRGQSGDAGTENEQVEVCHLTKALHSRERASRAYSAAASATSCGTGRFCSSTCTTSGVKLASSSAS